MSSKTFSIKLKYIIYAPPEKVFEALTKSSIINKWSDGNGKVSDKIDGDVEMFDGWVKGKVVQYKPGRKLSYTWKPSEWDKKVPPSLVSYTFSDHQAGTEVTLEHVGFPNEKEAEKHKDGWIDFVFEPLNDYFTS